MSTQDVPPQPGAASPLVPRAEALAGGNTRVRTDGRLPGLDALRSVAAVMVVVMHAGAIWPNAQRLASSAYLAVDFFFLLSGFVMGRTYERRMIAGALGPWRFLAARYRRLWPTMAVGALLCSPFLWRDGPELGDFLKAAVPNALLLPSFAAAALFPLNTPAWSIFFELVANMAHALFLYRMRLRELAVVSLIFLLPLALCAFRYGTLDLGARPANMGWGFARVGFSYALGLALWRWHGDRPPLRINALAALVAMPALFLAADAVPIGRGLYLFAFVAFGGPLLLWGGLALRLTGTGALRALCLAAGALSFPLYAIHYPVLLGVEALGLSMTTGAFLAVTAAALLTAAMGGFRHIRRKDITF